MKVLLILSLLVTILYFASSLPRHSFDIELELRDPDERANYYHDGKVHVGFVEKSGRRFYYTLTDAGKHDTFWPRRNVTYHLSLPILLKDIDHLTFEWEYMNKFIGLLMNPWERIRRSAVLFPIRISIIPIELMSTKDRKEATRSFCLGEPSVGVKEKTEVVFNMSCD